MNKLIVLAAVGVLAKNAYANMSKHRWVCGERGCGFWMWTNTPDGIIDGMKIHMWERHGKNIA